MDILEDRETNCRICLEQPALMDWNEEIHGSCGTTYRYCYYKYTQLDDNVADDYSQMLCETCSYDLKRFHFLIQKALESYNILQQTFVTLCQTSEIEVKIDVKNLIDEAGQFETVIFEKSTESFKNDNYEKDLLQLSFIEPSLEIPKNLKKEIIDKKIEKPKLVETPREISKDLKNGGVKVKLENHNFPEDVEVIIDIPHPEEEIDVRQSLLVDKPVLFKNRRIMCAYCPKLIVAQHMKKHEQTHKYRERSETCKKCGLKLFNKRALYNHMLIHQENREKRYKCEFCEKSYFNRGALNVHRRIHLGQLVPCPICSKEFCRQVDLEKHKASTHSADIQNKNFKVNKYFVECKDCGKSILSHQWKHHSLLHHSNKTQMKCTLCNKHFASKRSCHKHVRNVHKYKDEFAKVVEYYGDEVDKRTSHLMLSQFESVKPFIE